jgi:hypothetical protein
LAFPRTFLGLILVAAPTAQHRRHYGSAAMARQPEDHRSMNFIRRHIDEARWTEAGFP